MNISSNIINFVEDLNKLFKKYEIESISSIESEDSFIKIVDGKLVICGMIFKSK